MIVLIIVLGLIFRLISLNQSFWLDEATSGLVVRNFNLVEIITKFTPGDFHPPLYYLIFKVWSGVFGTNEIALRLPSVIFGLLTVYFIYLLGKELFNKKVGIVAGVLLATSGLHVYYSQEARMYALTAFLVTFSIFSFMKMLKNDRLGDWLLFSVSLFLIASSYYVAILIIPVFWLLGIALKKNSKWFLRLLTSHIILVVFAILWLPTFRNQLEIGSSLNSTSPAWSNLLGVFSLKNFALIPIKFILGRISFDNKYLYTLIAGFALLIFTYPLILALKKIKKSGLIWLWLVLPIVLGMMISWKLSIFSYFRFIFCLPAFYLLIGLGVSRIKKFPRLFLVLTLGLNIIFAGIYLVNPKFHREDWRGLVNFVETQKLPHSITLFVAEANMEAYRYYAPKATIAGPGGFYSQYREIWLMRYLQPVFDPDDVLRAKIEVSGYNKEKEYDFNGIVVWRYIKSP